MSQSEYAYEVPPIRRQGQILTLLQIYWCGKISQLPQATRDFLSSPLLSSPLPFSSLRKPLVPRVLSYITKYTPFCCWICAIQRVLHLNDLTILFSQLSRIFSVELNQLGQCSKLLSSIQVIVISTVLDFDMCYFTITPAKNTIIMLVQSEYS